MPHSPPRLYWTGRQAGSSWPLAPRSGQVWGLFAPAHVFDRGDFERARAVLAGWGIETLHSKKIFRRQGQLAGPDQHRLDLMTALMEDPRVGGLWAVRGGFGCQRLLPLLADRWPSWPAKPILGFSDLTALHLARLRAAGVIGWHGPMLAALGRAQDPRRLDSASRAGLKAFLQGGGRSGGWDFSPRDILKPGRARGPLLGGNLSLLVCLLDSPWLPDPTGAIVLIEEVDECPYRLERLLITLRQSRLWPALGGLVFGRFTGCGPAGRVRGLLRETAAACPGPVLMNAPFGHGPQNRLFPLGAWAGLEAEAA